MHSRSRQILSFAVLLVLLSIPIAAAARLTQSDLVLVRADDVVTEDLYAAGNRITIEGRIEGDLMAVAYGAVVISGEVTGDVMVVASRVTISGTVGGSVRVFASLVEVSGSIADDLAAVSWETVIGQSGFIGRDLINWGRNGRVGGAIERDLTGRFSRVTIDGAVGGSVELNVGSLVVDATAVIEGDVAYSSTREAEVNSSSIGGTVVQRTPLPPNIKVRALLLLVAFLVWSVLTATGLVVASSWPAQLEAAMAVVGKGWRTWLGGLGVLISPVIGLGALGFLVGVAPSQGAVPLAVVLLPIVIGLGGLVVLAALFGVIPAAAAFGKAVMRNRRSSAAAVLLGMSMFGVVMLIPLLRLVALTLLLPLGIGSLLWRRHSSTPEPPRHGSTRHGSTRHESTRHEPTAEE